MDCFKEKTFLNLELINAVRLHLRALYISDLTSQDGLHIVEVTNQYKSLETDRTMTLAWPEQPEPGKEAWKEWNGALSTLQNKKQKLNTTLGQWHRQLD